jgi:LEA14-like dessication related protein
MKIEKKHILVGVIGIVSVSAAVLYWQYKKLMDYCISLNKIMLKKFNVKEAEIDLYLNFKNNSAIKLEILSQEYTVLINDKEVVKAGNSNMLSVLPNSTSVLSVNVAFSPSKLINTIGSLAADILLNPQKINVTINIKVKVKLWAFTISIPYEFKSTLKDLLANKQQNSSTTNTKNC